MIWEIIQEAAVKSFSTLLLLTVILLPLMLLFEYARHYGVLERVSARLSWLSRWLTLSPEAALPLLLGMVLGLFYAAAMIIEYGRQGLLTRRELKLTGIFLAINHGVFEDNLVFAALGADFFFLFFFRLVAAIAITRLAACLIPYESSEKLPASQLRQ